jgi:hypothetical protein
MQISKTVFIITLALAGLAILNFGMRLLYTSGFNWFSLAAVGMGIGISLCALILTYNETGGTISFFRIIITAMVGVGIMVMGIMGVLTDATGMLLTVYYSIVFVSIVILCIALVMAYHEFMSNDINLTQ